MNSFSHLSQQTSMQQLKYLNSNIGLYNLFDKFQAHPPFTIPQHSLVIELQNITFGPNKYTVVIPQTHHQNFKIVYYSLLYYIFERNPQNKGTNIYQKLLQFILNNDMSLDNDQLRIPDEEVKTYLLKFLHMLHKQKCKHKIINDQLHTLPQMDLLLLHVIRKATKQTDLFIQYNASLIQQALKQNLGFSFQFLNTQTFAFEAQYIVDVRFFDKSCEFYIRHESAQIVNRLKYDIMLQESAHFMMESKKNLLIQEELLRKNGKKFKLTKKSTIQSTEWTEQAPQQQSPEKNTKDQVKCEPIEDRKVLINLDFIPFRHTKESSTISSLSSDPLTEKKTVKSIKSHHNRVRNLTQIQNFGLNYSADITSTITKNKMNYNQENTLNNCSIQKKFIGKFPNGFSNKSFLTANNAENSTTSRFLGVSHSATCIQSKSASSRKHIALRQTRIPSFILNRAKAKIQNQQKDTQRIQTVNKPKITFFYKNK